MTRVDLELWPSDQSLELPGSGSRLLIFRFGTTSLGAVAVTVDGRNLTPGSSHSDMRLDFWADEAVDVVRTGETFKVWLGGDVGSGVVTSVDADGA